MVPQVQIARRRNGLLIDLDLQAPEMGWTQCNICLRCVFEAAGTCMSRDGVCATPKPINHPRRTTAVVDSRVFAIGPLISVGQRPISFSAICTRSPSGLRFSRAHDGSIIPGMRWLRTNRNPRAYCETSSAPRMDNPLPPGSHWNSSSQRSLSPGRGRILVCRNLSGRSWPIARSSWNLTGGEIDGSRFE